MILEAFKHNTTMEWSLRPKCMEYKIRLYKITDYPEITRWYAATQEGAPSPGLFPVESTLIIEGDNTPIFCLSVYLTNTKEVCYLEGWIANPDVQGSIRREAADRLSEGACAFAKSLGYKRVLTFSYKDKIKTRITDLGYTRTLDNLSSFVKELT